MAYLREYLELSDDALLAQCQVETYKSSGPGGQHRNKVSSAVRLRHNTTGLTVHGDERRSQHANKASALARLRMNLACRIRCPVETESGDFSAVARECMFQPRGQTERSLKRLKVGRKDRRRFWQVAAFLLDVLDAFQGRLAESAAYLDITTSNFTSVLKSERHLLSAAQEIRKRFGQGPLK